MIARAAFGLPVAVAERVRPLREGGIDPTGAFVLYWMRTAVRGHENPALDAAVLVGNRLGKSVLVVGTLAEDEPYAADRFHTFALEGYRDAAAELAARGIAFALHVEREGNRGDPLPELVRRAALVVTEDLPVDPYEATAVALAKQTQVDFWCVDTACVLPMLAVDSAYERAFQFRRETARARDDRLRRPWVDAAPAGSGIEANGGAGTAHRPDLPFAPVAIATADIPSLVAACAIDHGIGPVPDTPGGSAAGYARWDAFRARGLAGYARQRNDALVDGVSRMSAYLHAGHVSPLRLAREAAAQGGEGAEKYLDELLIWRELAHVYCAHQRDHDSLATLPEWARQTLEEHRGDTRAALLSWEELARGRTGDALWDAAQRSLLTGGELHNNVRMTWGKALLGWTRGPEEALARLIELNHCFALDGRDPSSFGGILWCLGQFDRPFAPAVPVLGTVRPRLTSRHGDRLDVNAYAARTGRPATRRPLRVAVVGAGLAGLSAARTLADHGHEVVVLEKGRGPGGRTSHCQYEKFVFDHGAQYFTARDPGFRRLVDSWLAQGIVARWPARTTVFEAGQRRPSRGEHDRFVGMPGMNAMAVHLATDLAVHCSVLVDRLERRGAGWRLLDAGGVLVAEADVVLITAPPAQAMRLLDAAPLLAARVEEAVMRPCWAALLGFPERLPLDFDGAFVNEGPLSWVARNSSKPGRAGGEAWVLHAGSVWSEEHREDDAAEIAGLLHAEFSHRCAGGALPEPVLREAHRWRFAQPEPVLAERCLLDEDGRIGVAGDWCGGPRIEGAFLSGQALAGRVLGRAGVWTKSRR